MSMLYWPSAEGGRPPGAAARTRRRGLPRDRAPRARRRHAGPGRRGVRLVDRLDAVLLPEQGRAARLRAAAGGGGLRRVGEGTDERIRRHTAGGMSLADLRTAALELLPLDTSRSEESRVLLAFLAQAAVVPELAAAADDAAQRLQEPLTARI